MAGKTLPPGVGYLNGLPSILSRKCSATSPKDLLNLAMIKEAFDVVAANMVCKLGKDFQAACSRGLETEGALEETAITRLFTAKMHSYAYLYLRFNESISRAPAELAPVLKKLCALYGLYNINENGGSFLQYGYFSSEQMDWINELVSIIIFDS
jgi:acyl-CoA oxidase